MAISPTRPSIPEQLEKASFALDKLIRDARLSPRGRHDERHADHEERARAIAASIVAAYRGNPAPDARPLWFDSDGRKSSALF